MGVVFISGFLTGFPSSIVGVKFNLYKDSSRQNKDVSPNAERQRFKEQIP